MDMVEKALLVDVQASMVRSISPHLFVRRYAGCFLRGRNLSQMLCTEDEVKKLLDRQSEGLCSVSYGRSILPVRALIAGLSSQPCRCSRHRHAGMQLVPVTATPAVLARGRNPIWGDDKPLTLIEAAAYIGMAIGTLREKVYAREIAVVMVGKHPKVRPSAVRAYLERRERPAL